MEIDACLQQIMYDIGVVGLHVPYMHAVCVDLYMLISILPHCVFAGSNCVQVKRYS